MLPGPFSLSLPLPLTRPPFLSYPVVQATESVRDISSQKLLSLPWLCSARSADWLTGGGETRRGDAAPKPLESTEGREGGWEGCGEGMEVYFGALGLKSCRFVGGKCQSGPDIAAEPPPSPPDLVCSSLVSVGGEVGCVRGG